MSNGDIGLKEIGPGLYAHISPGGISNSGFIVGPEQVVVIDALMTPRLALDLQEEIRRVTPKPIGYLINSHHHGDHVFGNQCFWPQARILAHSYVRQRLIELGDEQVKSFARTRPQYAEELQAVKTTLPDLTYSDRFTFHWENRVIELTFMGPAHTNGDTLVYLPQEQVAYAADLLFTRIHPVLRDGHCGGWIQALHKLEGLEIGTVVPGHGLLSTKAQLTELREYLQELRQQVLALYGNGASVEQAIASVKLESFGDYSVPERLADSVRRVYQEVQAEAA